MRRYIIGSYTNDCFIILAETDSQAVAMFIRDSYREAYKHIGLECPIEILREADVPDNHTWSLA